MIKNERQYKMTRSQLDRFREALDNLDARPGGHDDPFRYRLEKGALDAQVLELRAQLEEYDSLKAGAAAIGTVESLDNLPQVLIRARIASGLTQRDLAERLGMPEQQVQRYEANDWSTASLSRLTDVAHVLGVGLTPSIEAPSVGVIEMRDLRRHLERAGLDRGFVDRRLAPSPGDGTNGAGTVLDLATRVNRIYGWTPSEVLTGADLEVEMPAAVGFKLPKGVKQSRLRAYAVYAHYIAHLALQATPTLQALPIPATATEFRATVLERSGSLDFSSILHFTWDLGIPVVPLADAGAFHAVVWREHGRNAIVLKQQVRASSRWAFDLLHEVRHAAEDPDAGEYAVIDEEAESADVAEVEANSFAGDVLLDGRANELAEESVREASGRLEFLKSAVPRVASRNNVATADLANYLAFRLSLQGENWWGAANNLQDGGVDPWERTCDVFLQRADLRALTPIDRDLLTQALSN